MIWLSRLADLVTGRRGNDDTAARLITVLEESKAASESTAREGVRVAKTADDGRRYIETIRTEIKERTRRQEAIARDKHIRTNDIRELVDTMLNHPESHDEGEGSC